MVLPCWPPADCPVHSRSRPEGGPAASRAPEGWPSGCGGPAGHGGARSLPAAPVACWMGCRPAPVSGPANRLPAGESRYAVLPVSSSEAAPPAGPGLSRWRGERRCPGVAARGAGVDGEAGAARREVGPGPGAARPDREHPPAPGLQRGHPQAAGRDLGPGPARVVGGPQLRPERPAVAAGQEPDLAHPGGAVGAVGGRRVDGAPGGAAGVGAPQHDAGGRGRLVALPGGQ